MCPMSDLGPQERDSRMTGVAENEFDAYKRPGYTWGSINSDADFIFGDFSQFTPNHPQIHSLEFLGSLKTDSQPKNWGTLHSNADVIYGKFPNVI